MATSTKNIISQMQEKWCEIISLSFAAKDPVKRMNGDLWSVRDLLAHIMVWDDWVCTHRSYLDPEEPLPVPDENSMDSFNEEIRRRYLNVPFESIYRLNVATQGDIMSLANQYEDQLAHTFEMQVRHYTEHLEQLRTKAEFMVSDLAKAQHLGMLAETNTAWNLLVRASSQFNADEMLLPGVIEGWSMKDMLAHITTWERIVIERLHGQHDRIEDTELSVDDVNEKQLQKNRDRDLGDIWFDFHASHGELMATMARIPDLTRQNIRQANHYLEHLPDIESWRAELDMKR